MAVRVPQVIYPNGVGTYNPLSGGGRVKPVPTNTIKGPAQGHQQINDPALSDATNRQLNQLQQQVNDANKQANSDPTNDKNIIRGLVFTSGSNLTVNHHLGRAYTGFVLNRPRLLTAGSPLLWEATAQPNPEAKIVLTALGTFTCDLEIY